MYARILVAVDGETSAHAALEHAAVIAKACHSRLHVLHIVDVLSHANGFERPSVYRQVVQPAMMAAGEKALNDAQFKLRERGVEAEVILERCDSRGVPQIIIETATAASAELIVLSTQGRSGFSRLMMGSDAEAVVRASTVPVLLVRHTADQNISPKGSEYERILVAVDGSKMAKLALDHAVRFARESGAYLHVVYVVEYPSALYMSEMVDPEPFHEAMTKEARVVLDQARACMDEYGVPGEIELVDTQDLGQSVADTLNAEAEKKGVDLVIMGTNGRRGFQRLVLGSVAESMVRRSMVPVLLVPGGVAGEE